MADLDAPVLVLGGTGHLGSSVVGSLVRMGQPVRVLTRNTARARQLLGSEPQLVEGDLVAEASVTSPKVGEALDGVRAVVICVSAFNPRLIRQMREIERDAVLMVFDRVRQAGIARLVYISTYDIRQDVVESLDLPIAQIKLEVEAALKASDLAWTILGAAPSMDIFFAMIRGDRMIVPGGGPPALPTTHLINPRITYQVLQSGFPMRIPRP